MKKNIAGFILAAVLIAGLANAAAIKVWVSGELLRYTDLNANFAHIHNLMVGGHGARLVNADVSTTAAIAHSKLAVPALVPKAFAAVFSTCAAGTCTIDSSSRVTSITWAAAGQYLITLAYTPVNASFAAITGPLQSNTECYPSTVQTAAPQITMQCRTISTLAGVNAPFQFLVMDE